GHGRSSKPSDGLHARFPRYGYLDMIEAQRRLLAEGLGVTHLRLVIGTSMGGMHTWLWGQLHPEMVDALLPLASLPTRISGRNRAWRGVIIDAIRRDPEWAGASTPSNPSRCAWPGRCCGSWARARSCASGRRRRSPRRTWRSMPISTAS